MFSIGSVLVCCVLCAVCARHDRSMAFMFYCCRSILYPNFANEREWIAATVRVFRVLPLLLENVQTWYVVYMHALDDIILHSTYISRKRQ